MTLTRISISQKYNGGKHDEQCCHHSCLRYRRPESCHQGDPPGYRRPQRGKNVTLFLLDEGVYLAKKGLLDNLRAATGDVADDLMTYLQAHGVPVLACTPCAKARGITETDLIDGARMGTAIELIHLACDAAVISL